MDFPLFLEFSQPTEAAPGTALAALLRAVPACAAALAHTPARARDPFPDDGAPPALVLQLYFARLLDLESAAGPGSAVARLAAALARDTGAAPRREALLTRHFDMPAPRPAADPGPWCTCLVAYEGPAEDANAWMHHDLTQHPPLMRQSPGLRELEICTSIDAVAFVPGPRVRHLQRNKVAFDSTAALDAALQSPVREQMRRDFAAFPPYTGRVLHHPMLTRAVRCG
jgi:uncharacterized protein (TIGR02118 family)